MSKSSKNKKISVIIPVYNDPSGLEDTLNSLVEQDFPKDLFEIIVADNGSTDSTLSVIENFADRYPGFIKKVQELNTQSSYAARNIGIKESGTPIVTFIDADMTVKKDWIKNVLKSLKKNQTRCLVCNVEVATGRKSVFALYDKMVSFPIKRYVKEYHFTPVGCLTIYTDIFKKIGLFDQKLISGGDREFGNRVYEAGYKISYAPDIVVKHPARYSLNKLLLKAFRVGRGLKQLSFYYPDRYKKKYRNILDPRNILPNMSIFRFTIAMRGNKIWDEASCIERTLFYLIYWSSCLGRYFGYAYESLFGIREKNL